MFFLMPVFTTYLKLRLLFLIIEVAAAILPAVYLLRYVYRHDTIEKEPSGLLAKLLLAGVVAAFASGVLEGLAQSVLNLFVAWDSPVYTVLLAFLVVAAVEEGMKFVLLRHLTWRNPAFDYRFDGIVYAVFVSLGFAALENIQYIFSYGLSVAVPRALLAVPGHMAFSVFMGVFYGRAKSQAERGGPAAASSLWSAYLIPVFLHGFYDSCAMSSSFLSTVLFVVFVALMFTAAFRAVRRESETDAPV